MTQPAPNFGTTLWTGPNAFGEIDIDPTGRVATGLDVLAQRLVLRQTTPLGSVIDAPNDCFDITDWLSANMTDAQVAQLRGTIQAELVKDEQVLAVLVSVTYTPANSTLIVTESVQTSSGPFSLTLTVTPGNVQALVGRITGAGQ